MSKVEDKTICQCPLCKAQREVTPLYAERGVAGLCLFLTTSIQDASPEVTFARVRESVQILVQQRKLDELGRLCREMLEFAATIDRDKGVQVMINQCHRDITSHIMESAVKVARDIGQAMGSLMLVVSNHDPEPEEVEPSPDSFQVDTPMQSGKPVVH